MGRLGTETAFEALARARALERQGRSIIHLGIGEPDFGSPSLAVEAAGRALLQGETRYGPPLGLPELRRAVALEFSHRLATDIPWERVVITPGGKALLFYTLLALCEEGDEVLYPTPGFPIYPSMIGFTGATPVPLPLRVERGFHPDPEEMAALLTPQTRLVILNSPGNPCGNLTPEANVRAMAELAAERGIPILSDEIYRDYIYEEPHRSPLRFGGGVNRGILLDGVSKSWGMTGWRVGFGLLPTELVEPISRLITNSVSCVPAFVQRGALAAVEGAWAEPVGRRELFRGRRDLLVQGLQELPGVQVVPPGGAFYAFPDIRGTGWESDRLERALLEQAGVALLSGRSFGVEGEGFLRISFAAAEDQLREGVARIGDFLAATPPS